MRSQRPLTPGVYVRGGYGVVTLALVAALVDSCLPLDDAAEETSPTQGPPPATDQAAPDVTGVWQGRYECAQGATGLTLTIALDPAGGSRLAARFAFYPIPENLEVAAGVFTMVGEHADGRLRLRPDEWVEQPPEYFMVELDAQVPGGTAPETLAGTVGGRGCSDFEVDRVSLPDPPSPADPVFTPALAGEWEGSYTCGDVRRGLTLIATPAEDGRFQATFEFHPLPEEQDSEAGSFAMTGYHSRSGMVAVPDRWIDRPTGYVMVGLHADIPEPDPSRLRGRVDEPGCQDFTISRVSADWTAPPA